MTTEFQWDEKTVIELLNSIHDRENKIWLPIIKQFIASKTKHKEYEILSYRNDFGTIVEAKYILPYPIEKVHKIHSVKRLSDNEVFSIGDEVVVYGKQFKIKRVFLKFEDRTDGGYADDLILSALDKYNLQKAKPILFTTSDGVGMRHQEMYVKVWDNFTCQEIQAHELSNISIDYIKTTFSTKEKALEYINLNKPVLSVNDLFLLGITEHHTYFKMMKKIAKSKINQ